MTLVNREWLDLGDTSVDMTQILKIAFGKDARLFALAGDALVLTAWTEERILVAKLRQIASQHDGWINVKSELTPEPDFSDPEDAEDTGIDLADERLCLKFVDKIITTKTKHGQALEMFSGGVFVGEVYGDDITVVKDYLGL
jgi:hypothetical protein